MSSPASSRIASATLIADQTSRTRLRRISAGSCGWTTRRRWARASPWSPAARRASSPRCRRSRPGCCPPRSRLSRSSRTDAVTIRGHGPARRPRIGPPAVRRRRGRRAAGRPRRVRRSPPGPPRVVRRDRAISAGQGLDRSARRRRRVQAGERDRVDPRLPRASVARPLRSCRGAFAGQAVLRVQAEQALEAGHPGCVVADQDRGPCVRLPRPDGHSIAARVVDERDGGDRAPRRPVGALALPERRGPELPDRGHRGPDPRRQLERDGLEVLARLDVRGVGSGAREDDRMIVLALEERVVPAAAQVRPDLVMGRPGEPDRRRGAVVAFLEEDEALLPVRLVIVRPGERCPPVVHGVEEQVVADRPAGVAHDPSVVGELGVALVRISRVLDLAPRRRSHRGRYRARGARGRSRRR